MFLKLESDTGCVPIHVTVCEEKRPDVGEEEFFWAGLLNILKL